MRGFFRRWKRGMMVLTPLQLLRGKRWAIGGQCLGCLLALGYLVNSGLWWWVSFLGATFALLVVELVSVQKQVWKLEEFTW